MVWWCAGTHWLGQGTLLMCVLGAGGCLCGSPAVVVHCGTQLLTAVSPASLACCGFACVDVWLLQQTCRRDWWWCVPGYCRVPRAWLCSPWSARSQQHACVLGRAASQPANQAASFVALDSLRCGPLCRDAVDLQGRLAVNIRPPAHTQARTRGYVHNTHHSPVFAATSWVGQQPVSQGECVCMAGAVHCAERPPPCALCVLSKGTLLLCLRPDTHQS